MNATFLDFDGTLADTNLVQVYAFYARHAGRRGEAVGRLARLAAWAPALAALDHVSRMAFARKLFSQYRGFSQDRLETLAPTLDREVIQPRERKGLKAFLEGCRGKGALVLVTGAPEFSVRAFARRHHFDAVIANQLEFRGGVATGNLIPPVVFGPEKGRLIRRWAQENDIDLESSSAYTDSISDLGLLDVVGRGAVVSPDGRLARLAKDHHWPIVTL